MWPIRSNPSIHPCIIHLELHTNYHHHQNSIPTVLEFVTWIILFHFNLFYVKFLSIFSFFPLPLQCTALLFFIDLTNLIWSIPTTENPDGYEIEPLSSELGLVNSNPPFYWLTRIERLSNGPGCAGHGPAWPNPSTLRSPLFNQMALDQRGIEPHPSGRGSRKTRCAVRRNVDAR